MAVATPLVSCPACDTPLPAHSYNTGEAEPCPGCEVLVRTEVFPALAAKPRDGRVGEEIIVDGQSSCFYHPNKQAETHCAGCGRFLCALCDVNVGEKHYCTQCVEAGVSRGKIANLQRGGVQYDRIGFAVAVASVIPFVTIFAAPTALYFALRYWNRSESLVRKSRGWNVATIVISSLTILFQCIIIAKIVWG